jgi:glycosyltransferase involved in cell wall biosynthesis
MVKTVALLLESDAPGGAEIFLLHSAEELRRRGYRVVPMLPTNRTGWLAEQFRQRGFSPGAFAVRRPLDPGCLMRMVRDLRRLEVDVLHSHEFGMAVYGAAAARLLGKRHIVTMHGNMWMTQALRRRIALRWAFRRSHAVVAVSEDTRAHLVTSLGVAPESILTIPNGVPRSSGRPEGPIREFSLQPGEVVLLSVGNLTERKGHFVLLEALARLQAEGCRVPWRLIVAGEGPERPRLEAFVAEHGLQGRVHLPGHRSDVADLQSAADIMVMPSLWEGLPLAVLEGMHAGNAIVGSHISGIPEAVRHEVDGLLVPPGDAGALAAALRRVLEDGELRERLGASAAERARARFSIERMMDDYEALYWGAPQRPVRRSCR